MANIIQEYSSIPLKLKFLNGCTIGINNQLLKIEISFKSPIPLSFTTRIDFVDDEKRVFPIYVSGTTDNSILTNFVFFIKNKNFGIKFDVNKGP